MRYLRPAVMAVLFLSAAGVVRAADDIKLANMPPVVVSTEPRAGQTDVAPGATEIRVTFSRPMQDGNWSWVKLSDGGFPKLNGNPHFLPDQRTCVLPVTLGPGSTYAIWLNHAPAEKFQDKDGHKAVPYLLAFETKR